MPRSKPTTDRRTAAPRSRPAALDHVIDVGDTRGEIIGGVFELATRTSDGKREWYLDGTWKAGGAATMRRVIACCEEHRSALSCLG